MDAGELRGESVGKKSRNKRRRREYGAEAPGSSPFSGELRWMRLALPALLILAPWALAFVVYAPRLGDYFALDDFVLLRAVHGRGTASVIARAFTLPEATPFEAPMPFWRPAADCFFYVEYLLFGLNSTPYHVVNVASTRSLPRWVAYSPHG